MVLLFIKAMVAAKPFQVVMQLGFLMHPLALGPYKL